MANRNFRPGAMTLENESRKIYARCAIGLAGAVGSIEGTGVSTITKEGTGLYSVTLEDNYNKVLLAVAQFTQNAMNSVTTAVTGTAEVATLSFAATSSCTSGDFAVFTDTNGALWAFAIDKTGSAPEPTSAIWSAIPAAKKVNINISGATTGAQVATAVESAFDALSGVGSVITTTVSVADIAFAHVYRKNVTNVALYKSDGTATPTSFTAATVSGVDTAVDITANSVAFVAHGLTTGRDIALSIGGGSLPAGLSATTYYAVVVDANTIKFATSLANAEAGTVVDITDYGTATQTMTITPGAILGSKVAKCEFLNSIQANVASGGKLYFNCYDYAGALIQPSNGSLLLAEITCRNSDVKAKGEA